MRLQDNRDDSIMSLKLVLADCRQSPHGSGNPMDLRAMLNPSTDEFEMFRNNIKKEIRQYSTNSPGDNGGEYYFQLPPMKLEQSSPAHHQSSQACHIADLQLSPPQSPHSASYHRRTFPTVYHHGYLTPPPSSPQYPQDNYDHSNFRAEAPVYHHISPRQRGDQEYRVRDAYWNVPVQASSNCTSYSPPYHTHGRSSPLSRKPSHQVPRLRNHLGPHSNKPYTVEQVHWMRYHREDLVLIWPQVHTLFYATFPDTERLSVPCITSRYYRDNVVPKLDANGEAVRDKNGKVVMIKAKVRDRATAEGKAKPYKFVDKHPEFALGYDWVKPEDKARAMRILQGLKEPMADGEMSEYQKYQRGLRKLDGQKQELIHNLAQVNNGSIISKL